MKTVLITGASRGIGLEMVHQFLSDGWKVIACSRTFKNHSASGMLIQIGLDLTDASQIENLAAVLKQESIDILINNAGLSGPANEELDVLSPSSWLETFHVNTVGPYMLVKALLSQIERSSLKVIANISSSYGSIHLNSKGDYCVYRSSKAALNAVTKCLAISLQEKGITVVSIHPGSVKTDENPEGKISPAESVQGIKKALSSLRLEDSGSFINYKCETLPW